MRTTLLACVLAVGVGGCCLKKISVRSEVSATGTGSGDVSFDFGECLSKEEEKIVLDIKQKLLGCYDNFLAKKTTEAEYNAQVKAAHKALDVAMRVVKKEPIEGVAPISRERAFANVQKVADSIQ